eukprot:11707146-Alexandrium_andersonii.AAC.1
MRPPQPAAQAEAARLPMPPADTLRALNELFDSEAVADARAGPIRFDAANPSPPDGRATEWALHGEPGERHWHR